jgi:hypothetical protein
VAPLNLRKSRRSKILLMISPYFFCAAK